MFFPRLFWIVFFLFLDFGKTFAENPISVDLPGSLFPDPYEAIYQLNLESVSPESLTEEAQGVLSVKLQSVGNGWTLQQQGNLKIRMAYDPEEGEQEQNSLQQIEWIYVTWEAKNGRHFRFLFRRWIDGILEDDTQGEMDYDPQLRQGTINYQVPVILAQPFYGEVLFPTAYMGKVLEKIREGGGVVSSLVFNGLSGEGLLRLNTFVGRPHKVSLPFHKTPQPSAASPKMKNFIIYPTFTASYHPKSQEEQPDSESAQEITAQGFPVSSLLDLGDFKLKANLQLSFSGGKKKATIPPHPTLGDKKTKVFPQ